MRPEHKATGARWRGAAARGHKRRNTSFDVRKRRKKNRTRLSNSSLQVISRVLLPKRRGIAQKQRSDKTKLPRREPTIQRTSSTAITVSNLFAAKTTTPPSPDLFCLCLSPVVSPVQERSRLELFSRSTHNVAQDSAYPSLVAHRCDGAQHPLGSQGCRRCGGRLGGAEKGRKCHKQKIEPTQQVGRERGGGQDRGKGAGAARCCGVWR